MGNKCASVPKDARELEVYEMPGDALRRSCAGHVTAWNDLDETSRAQLTKEGFNSIPSFKEFYDTYAAKKSKKQKDKSFMEYWELMYKLKVPMFPKPRATADPQGRYTELGAFDEQSVKCTIKKYGLEMDPQIHEYTDYKYERYPEVIEKYMKYRLGAKEYADPADYIKVKVWKEYYKTVENKESQKFAKLRSGVLPDCYRFRAVEQPFPKRCVGVKSFVIWDHKYNPHKTNKQIQKLLNVLKEKVMMKDITIPGIEDPSKAFVGCYANSAYGRSVPDLEHYHFVFRWDESTKTPGLDVLNAIEQDTGYEPVMHVSSEPELTTNTCTFPELPSSSDSSSEQVEEKKQTPSSHRSENRSHSRTKKRIFPAHDINKIRRLRRLLGA